MRDFIPSRSDNEYKVFLDLKKDNMRKLTGEPRNSPQVNYVYGMLT